MPEKSENQILVLGSIAYDNIMKFEGDLNDNLTSDKAKKIFNIAVMPSSKTVNWGGTAGNISYNIGQIGAKAIVINAVGKDFVDNGYQKHFAENPSLKFAGDLYSDQFSANCYIVNDINHNQMIIFHAGAMVNCPKIKLKDKDISKDTIKIATVSPDNYQAMINYARELSTLEIPFLLDPGQVTPAFTAEILKELIPKAKLLIGNEFELKMIREKLQMDITDILKLNPTIIMTKGSKGSIIYDHGQMIEIPLVKADKVIDTTGAGDGYRAGLLFGLANNLSLKESAQIGAVVGSFVVETLGPQTQKFSKDKLKKRYEKAFGSPLKL